MTINFPTKDQTKPTRVELKTYDFRLTVHDFRISLQAPAGLDTRKVAETLLKAVEVSFDDSTLRRCCPEVCFQRRLEYDALVADATCELVDEG